MPASAPLLLLHVVRVYNSLCLPPLVRTRGVEAAVRSLLWLNVRARAVQARVARERLHAVVGAVMALNDAVDVPALQSHADRARLLARANAARTIQRAFVRHLYHPRHAWHARAMRKDCASLVITSTAGPTAWPSLVPAAR